MSGKSLENFRITPSLYGPNKLGYTCATTGNTIWENYYHFFKPKNYSKFGFNPVTWINKEGIASNLI